MTKKSWVSDFISQRAVDKVARLSLSDIQVSPFLEPVDENDEENSHPLSSARNVICESKTLKTMFLENSGAGLRFLSWADRLANQLHVPDFAAADLGTYDHLPVEATPLIVLETRLLGELGRLHKSKEILLTADISGFKMLTGSGLDQRMLALSALISPEAVDAYMHGPCGSMLWHAVSGGKKELHGVCNHFFRLTGFSQNDLNCIGAVSTDFWQALFKYIPELFFSFYAASIAHYRLGERTGCKRSASDMIVYQEVYSKEMSLLTRKQQSIAGSRELAILKEVADILYANSICRTRAGFDLDALFGAQNSADKRIADDVVSSDFCSHGLIDQALRHNYWQNFVGNGRCKHEVEFRDGVLLLIRSGGMTLAQGAVAAWSRDEPFETIGLTRYYLV